MILICKQSPSHNHSQPPDGHLHFLNKKNVITCYVAAFIYEGKKCTWIYDVIHYGIFHILYKYSMHVICYDVYNNMMIGLVWVSLPRSLHPWSLILEPWSLHPGSWSRQTVPTSSTPPCCGPRWYTPPRTAYRRQGPLLVTRMRLRSPVDEKQYVVQKEREGGGVDRHAEMFSISTLGEKRWGSGTCRHSDADTNSSTMSPLQTLSLLEVRGTPPLQAHVPKRSTPRTKQTAK